MYILYGGPFTRALIVEMVLTEGGLDYQLRPVEIVKDEHRSTEFLALNPAGRVPVLVTPQGDVLSETPAINLYLAERHNLAQIAPGVDAPERGLFLSGLFYLTNELEPAMKRYFYPHRFAPRAEDTLTVKESAFEAGVTCLRVIDRKLETHGPYYLGQRFSLVDLTMAYWMVCIGRKDVLQSLPAVWRCMELVMERPTLRGRFETLIEGISEYARLQARGKGIA